jgi:phosphoribosylformimino-5-aminoimidazole carboxamide ribotide isomerase
VGLAKQARRGIRLAEQARRIPTIDMQLIGVIDLLRGHAVHARSGVRATYRPVVTAAGTTIDGDAIALARAYIGRGVPELYVADLDAIAGQPWQTDLVRSIAALGAPVWLDSAVRTASDAGRALASGAGRIVVGLETLGSFGELADICATVGASRTAFSLDLRDGVPMHVPADAMPGDSIATIATRAAAAGVGSIIVLDVARVGTGRGIDRDAIASVRGATGDVMVLAGGGVRGPADLEALAAVGCDGALVATAIHAGLLDPRHSSVSR